MSKFGFVIFTVGTYLYLPILQFYRIMKFYRKDIANNESNIIFGYIMFYLKKHIKIIIAI